MRIARRVIGEIDEGRVLALLAPKCGSFAAGVVHEAHTYTYVQAYRA